MSGARVVIGEQGERGRGTDLNPATPATLTESEIRAAVLERVSRRWAAEGRTVVVEEFGTHYGGARVDIAVINGCMRGYEIKSAADRLNRLPSQVLAYGEVFDNMTLVVTSRHMESALRLIPSWWEVILASPHSGGPHLRRVLCGRRNHATKAGAVARLLWRDELAALLAGLGCDSGVRSATRDRLADRLVESTTRGELASLVRDQIRARPAWRADPSRSPDDEMSRRSHMSSGFLARRLR